MKQYIPKSVLVAEIEKIRAKWFGINNDFADGQKVALTNVLSLIDILEVKEVDLKKEFSQWWKDERTKDYNVDILYERYSNASIKLAKHFFELGIKSRKGEEVCGLK